MRKLLITMVLLQVFGACSKKGAESKRDPEEEQRQFIDYMKARVPMKIPEGDFDPEHEPSKVLLDEDGVGIYSDRIVLLLKDHHSEEAIRELNTLVDSLNAEIIGKIGKYGHYTIRVNTSTEQELLDLISQIETHTFIQGASTVISNSGDFVITNPVYSSKKKEIKNSTVTKEDYCKYQTGDNLLNISGNASCAFKGMEYYQTFAMLNALRKDGLFSNNTHLVNVIFDHQFSLNHEEFDLDKMIIEADVEVPLARPEERVPQSNLGGRNDEHGTSVASVMVAKENGKTSAGYGSSLINNLTTYIYDKTPTLNWVSYEREISRIMETNVVAHSFCTEYGVCDFDKIAVFNLSAYWGVIDSAQCNARIRRITKNIIRPFFQKMISEPENKDTVFIVGMPNQDPSGMTTFPEDCYAPAGLDATNLITVAGHRSYQNQTDVCQTHELYGSFGNGVTIFAPAENIALLDLTTANGNSMATPIVSSLVLLIKSINPSLTPIQIKEYITKYSEYHQDNRWCERVPQVCGSGWSDIDNAEFPRASFYLPVMKVLMDKEKCKTNRSKEICKAINLFGGELPDHSSFALNRLCGGLNLESSYFGDHKIDSCSNDPMSTTGDICTEDFASGTIDPMSKTTRITSNSDDLMLTIDCRDPQTFTLSELGIGGYPIMSPEDIGDGNKACGVTLFHSGKNYLSVSGDLEFDYCIINSYSITNGNPSSVSVWGSFSSILTEPGNITDGYELYGQLALEFFSNTAIMNDEAVVSYLLENCVN
ncbi:S8/S53 family peptidase [Myxococcota bacterium]|nr:S8/S53 family peptidase [Myxococcota bacterium]MBU1534424.1 S8/S53 family peptidase [Myxococcota bacterium]